MLTSDNKQWLAATREDLMTIASEWSKKMTARKLERLIGWYRVVQLKVSARLNNAEKMGASTENTQEMQAVHNMEITALVARFMRECPKEQVPEYLFD